MCTACFGSLKWKQILKCQLKLDRKMKSSLWIRSSSKHSWQNNDRETIENTDEVQRHYSKLLARNMTERKCISEVISVSVIKCQTVTTNSLKANLPKKLSISPPNIWISPHLNMSKKHRSTEEVVWFRIICAGLTVRP